MAFDSNYVQVINSGAIVSDTNPFPVDVASSALPTGAATADNQTNGNQLTRIVDLHGHQANVQAIANAIDGTEYALVTNSIIHGKSSAGGGAWVDVKVNPSGALVIPDGASTAANQTNGTQIAKPYLVDEFGVQSQMLSDNLYSGAPVMIDVAHHEIHCGDSFVANRIATLGNGAVDSLIINVPNEVGSPQKKYHLTVGVDFSTDCTYELFEGATTSNDGTGITWYNRERNSALTTALALFHTPTVTGTGTLVDTARAGTRSTGGVVDRGQEFILKNNTKYLLRITNNVPTSGFVSWKLNHYIHPGI